MRLRLTVMALQLLIGGAGELAAQATVPELTAALRDKDARVRHNAALGLSDIGPGAKPVIPQLIEALKDDAQPTILRAYTMGFAVRGDSFWARTDPVEEPDRTVRGAAQIALLSIGPLAIPELTAALGNTDARVRGGAAWVLGRLGTFPGNTLVPEADMVAPQLAMGLSDPDEQASENAFAALYYRIGSLRKREKPIPAEVLTYAIAALGDTRFTVRMRATDALGSVGPDAVTAVPQLVHALQDASFKVAAHACAALGEIGPSAKAAVPGITAAFDTLVQQRELAEPTLRIIFYGALGKFGPEAREAVPLVVGGLNHPDAKVRYSAATALGKLGPAAGQAIPQLIAALKDNEIGPTEEPRGRDRTVAAAAATALINIGPRGDEFMEQLVALFGDSNKATTVNAGNVLAALGLPAVPYLSAALADKNPTVGVESAKILGRIGPSAREAIPLLVPALSAPDWKLRESATEALGKIRVGGTEVITALTARLQDERESVGIAAAVALKDLGLAAVDAVPSLCNAIRNKDSALRDKELDALISIIEAFEEKPEKSKMPQIASSFEPLSDVTGLTENQRRALDHTLATFRVVRQSVNLAVPDTLGDLTADRDIASLLAASGNVLLNGSEVEVKVAEGSRVSLLGDGPNPGINVIQTVKGRLLAWYENRTLAVFEHPYKNSYAVIVAIDDYERKKDPRRRGPTGFRQLGQMVSWAEKLKATLLQHGFASDHVLTFYNQEADSKDVNAALETFWAGGKRADADRLFFYFGGHGSHVEDVGYLVTYDYDPQKPTLTSLLMRDLTGRHSDNILAHHFLVALDACSSGLAVSTLGDEQRQQDRAERRRVRGLSIIRNDTTPKARNVLVAGTGDQSALYDNGGVFTQALVRGLQGEGDLNHDGIIQFPELAVFVSDEVADAVSNKIDQKVGYYKLPRAAGEVLFLKEGSI